MKFGWPQYELPVAFVPWSEITIVITTLITIVAYAVATIIVWWSSWVSAASCCATTTVVVVTVTVIIRSHSITVVILFYKYKILINIFGFLWECTYLHDSNRLLELNSCNMDPDYRNHFHDNHCSHHICYHNDHRIRLLAAWHCSTFDDHRTGYCTGDHRIFWWNLNWKKLNR